MSTAPPEVATVAATLRQAAEWVGRKNRGMLLEVAEDVERNWDDICCPVCEEGTCDEGCPLESVRAALEQADQ